MVKFHDFIGLVALNKLLLNKCNTILLSGIFRQKGVFTMEALASDSKLFDFIMMYLSNRNIQFVNGMISKNSESNNVFG